MKLSMKNSVVVRRRVSHARPGQALVPVLLVMLILTILSIAFAVSAQREIKSGTNFVSQTQRYYAARGAAMYAASSLANSSSNGATYGIVQKTGDTDANGWRQIGEAWMKIEVVDSAASLSLNGADLATLQRFPVLKDSPELVAAILDWRTPGDQPSENGAKNEYYSALNPAYNCKNAPYETVEELLLVKGITPTILYGNASGSAISQSDLQSAQSASSNSAGGSLSFGSSSSRSGTRQAPQPGQAGQGNNGGQNGQGSGQNGGQNGQNGQANPTGQDAQPQDDAAQFQDIFTNSHIPLSELLTPTSRERNISADGQPRVNINTATQEELTQKLSLPANVVRNLINYRNGGDGGVGGGRPRNRPNGGQNGQGGGQNGQGGNGGQGNNGGQGGGQNGNGRPRQNGGRPRLNRPRIFSRSANDLTAESNTRQAAPAPGNSRPNGGNGGQNGGGKPRPNGGQGSYGGQGGGNGQGNNGGQGGNGGGQNGGQNGQGGTGGAKKTFRTIGDLLEVNGITRSVMQKIADKVTIDDATVRENVVNINTAPSEVLATVPGMTRTMLDAIIGYRGGGQAFQTLGDLFTLQTIQRADFEKAIGSLTTKSSLYTVRVKVKMPNSSGIYATTALVELTENGPRIRQWREVSRSPGWSQWISSPVLPQPGQSSTPEAQDDSATPSPQGQNGANR